MLCHICVGIVPESLEIGTGDLRIAIWKRLPDREAEYNDCYICRLLEGHKLARRIDFSKDMMLFATMVKGQNLDQQVQQLGITLKSNESWDDGISANISLIAKGGPPLQTPLSTIPVLTIDLLTDQFPRPRRRHLSRWPCPANGEVTQHWLGAELELCQTLVAVLSTWSSSLSAYQ